MGGTCFCLRSDQMTEYSLNFSIHRWYTVFLPALFNLSQKVINYERDDAFYVMSRKTPQVNKHNKTMHSRQK